MTLTIGRVTISESPTVAAHTGDVFDLVFTVGRASTAGSAIVGKVLRQQLLGLADNPDEPVVPVTSTDDPDLDGYYQVNDVQCEPFAAFLGNGAMRVSVTLERIANGYSMPVLEMVSSAPIRTNGVGVSSAAVGRRAYRFNTIGAYDAFNGSTNLVGADGTSISDEVESPWAMDTAKVFTPPATFYKNTAMIERLVSGTWYKVVGRQAPAGMAGAWRISNGLVRFTASQTTVGDLKVEVWDSGAWVAMETELRFGTSDGAGSFSGTVDGFATGWDDVTGRIWVAPHIIRNDRDTVILGVRRQDGRVQTFTLHAADQFCEFYSYIGGSSFQAIQSRSAWTTSTITAVAPFTATPGIQSNANDANGNRLIILYTRDASFGRYTVTVSGVYQTTSATSATFGIGASTSTSNLGLRPIDLANYYVSAKTWRTFPVAQ